MRRARTVGLLGALLVLALLLAAVTVGCGTATQNSGQPQATPTMRQGILQQALANMSTLTSGTGDINVSLTVTGDQATMPAGA